MKHKKENPEANLKKTVHKTRAKKKLVVHKDAEPKAVEPKQSDQQYIFERFCQLYQHSRHARFSFALIVLFGRTTKTSGLTRPVGTKNEDSPAKRQAMAEVEYEPEEEGHGWFHRPYPYSGFLRFIVAMTGLCALVVLGQIMYPSGMTLPLSRLDSNGYAGFKTQADIISKTDEINHRLTMVSTKDARVTATPLEMGVRAQGEETFKQLSDYPLGKRLIPFSIVFSSIKSDKVSREIDVEKLKEFTESVVTVTSREPRNAKIEMQGTKFVISPSEDGYEYEERSIQKQLAQTPLGNEEISLLPRMIPAQLSTKTAEDSIAAMQKRIDAGLTISASDQNLRIGPETIASWVVIEHKPEIQTVTLSFNKDKVIESLRPLAIAVDRPDIPDQVTMLNGVEAGRKYGTPGQTLQFDDLVNQVVSASDWTVGLIQAKVNTIVPRQVFTRVYSKDSTGMQSLFDYWVKNNKGRFGIDMRTQNGRISASSNSFKVFNGAYKLYLPHLVYGQISTRKLNPGAATSTGYTIDGCIDKLVLSGHDNCARALGDIVGWGNNNSLLASQNLSDTALGVGTGSTSANDAALWAMQLLNGSLTSFAQRSNMISLMSEQSLRSGIPVGSRGAAVANTAGISGGLRYDVGIVYHPRGTYVLSIFSEGSSFAAIADLAEQVNRVMSQ